MSTLGASSARGVAGPRARAARRLRGGWRGLSGIVVVVILAELASRTALISPAALPPISEVLVEAARLLLDGAFLAEVRATVVAAGTGLGLATLVAVPVGLLLGSFRLANQAASAVIEFLRPIPSVALIPLAILVYGQGAQMKIALVVYACLWPIVFNTVYGVRDVEPLAKETARVYRTARLRVLTHVLLPSAAPFIATGIRIAAAIALIVTISAELLAGAASGVGSWILAMSSGGASLSLVYAGTLFAGLLGLILNTSLVAVERRLFRWNSVQQGDR